MIADGLRNHHKAGILITNTRPQQLGYSDTRKQQSRVFPLNPKSNLSFPMLRQATAQDLPCKATVLLQCEAKMSHFIQTEQTQDPKQADVPGSTLLRVSWIWLTAHHSYTRGLKENQLSLLLPSRRG